MDEIYQELFQNVTFPVFIVDLEDKIVFLNSAAKKSYGINSKDNEECISITSFFQENAYEKIKHEILDKGMIEQVTQRKNCTGNSLFFYTYFNLIGNGKYISIMDRIVDHKVHLKEIIHMVIDTSPDAVIVANKEGNICYSNKNAEDLFEYGSNELNGQHLNSLIPSRYHANHGAHVNKYFESYKVRPMGSGVNIFGVKKEGEEFSADICLSPLKSPDEPLVIAAIRDVTERKKNEQLLVEQSQKLTQANEELEQFVFVASHDLQEPLNTILQYLFLIDEKAKGALDEECLGFLASLKKGTERMSALINDLLVLARIGREATALSSVKCSDVIQGIQEDLDAQIKRTNAEIKVIRPLPEINAYESSLKLLFQNLITNAIKYVEPNAQPKIEIDFEDKDNEWVFSVKDYGIGIDKEHFDKLFNPFQRLHKRTEYEGTGIGLAHCKKVIELHGGKIWLTSNPGEGSTFFFTIPKEIQAP